MESYLSRSAIDRILKQDARSGYLDPLTETIAKTTTVKDESGKETTETKSVEVLTEASKKNREAYELFINTWFSVISDNTVKFEDELLPALLNRVSSTGLITFIKECDDFFNAFLREKQIPTYDYILESMMHCIKQNHTDVEWVQVASEVFRFGKRFSPFGSSKLATDCVRDFWRNEAINRVNDREETREYYNLVTLIKDEHAYLFKGFCIDTKKLTINGDVTISYKERPYVKWDKLDMHLSPNAIQGTCTSKLCKRIALESLLRVDNPLLSRCDQDAIASLLVANRYNYFREVFMKGSNHGIFPCNTVGSKWVVGTTVPKNLGSYRLIGPDQVGEYHDESVVETELRRVIEKGFVVLGNWELNPDTDNYEFKTKKRVQPLIEVVPIDDQSTQRFKAQEGSISGMIATFDLKSASDLVRKSLVRSVYPAHVSEPLLAFMPRGMILPEGKHLRAEVLCMFGPMGCPLTFRNMQLLLFMVLDSATNMAGRLFRWSSERLIQAKTRMGVFGDDITCDKEVAEILHYFLNTLGFIVNDKKTWYDDEAPHFREACGGDYLNGVDIAPRYWPRKQLDITVRNSAWHVDGFSGELQDSLSMLIDMSKAIRRFSPTAATYLNTVCRKIEPKLTISPLGSNTPDLQSSFPWAKPKAPSPYAKVTYVSEPAAQVFQIGSKNERSSCITEKKVPTKNPSVKEREMLKAHMPEAFRDGKDAPNWYFTQIGQLHIELLSKNPWNRKHFKQKLVNVDPPKDDGGMELTCTPKAVFERKPLCKGNCKCVVEQYLQQHNISVDDLLSYYSYLEFLEKGPDYEDGLSELLHISRRRNENAWFSNPKLNWTLARR